ncbi:PAS domain S-box protein [Methylobacillus methanolivorans]|uniref:histidine kinase n=1 Tax=Methylobacillus methanolivorans TaxID=1848927 RepID=A0ABW8GHS6_9PROT
MNVFDQFFYQANTALPFIAGFYDLWMVALSILVAITSSIIALQLSRMSLAQSSTLGKKLIVLAGAVALGAGIWSMHFIGMMAYQLCFQIRYSPGLTILSILPGIFASWYALSLLTRDHVSLLRLITGGIVVGTGIGMMHYSGMLAMNMTPLLRFNLAGFLISLLVAISLATVALWVVFYLKRNKIHPLSSLLLGGILMGCAIAAMHYTGMAAAVYLGEADLSFDPSQNKTDALGLSIAIVTILIGILAIVSNLLFRYRQLLESLTASETRLTTILDSAVDGIITVDAQGNIHSFNLAAEKLFGWSMVDVLGKKATLLMPDHYHAIYDGLLSRYLATGKSTILGSNQEVQGLRRNGEIFPATISMNKAMIAGQMMFVTFISDITAQKRIEAKIKEQHDQINSLMSNMPGITFRCKFDAKWTMLLINDAVRNITGWSANEFLNGTIFFADITHPDDAIRIQNEISQALLSENHYSIEYRIYDKHGHEHWVAETGSGIRDETGNLVWLDGVIIDTTESKLRNAEFESVVKAMNYATSMAEFTIDGHIIHANANFLHVTGYQLHEIVGKHHTIFCTAESQSSQAYQDKWRALRAGEYVQGEYLRLAKDGRHIWINAYYSPVFDVDGQVSKIIMSMIDISERISMENDLKEAKERAEQASSVKSSFMANMSHEIRTPMNAIIGFSDVLLDSPMPEDQRHYLNTISMSAKSLLHLLNDILDSAKLEKGKLELEMLDFGLTELVDNVISTLWIQARRKGIELKLDIAPEVQGSFHGAPDRIRQVLMNLLGNGIKFTEQGHVMLKIQQLDDQTLQFDVEDTGIGIAADRLESIFEPFTQADASMSRRFGGTGLGSTISKQLIELMGGSLTATSTLGKGSCFTVILPLASVQDPAPTLEAIQHQLPPLHILVADDIQQNIELLTVLLSKGGHTISIARDGAEAVLLFQKEQFDLILMDVQMPGMDGLIASSNIRLIEAQRKQAHTPIIALTASVLTEDRIAAKQAGMDGFASKPINMAALTTEIIRVLALDIPTANAIQHEPPRQDDTSSIRMDKGIALWGDRDVYLHELQRFSTETLSHGSHFKELLALKDYAGIRSFAHAGKGVSGNLALDTLYKLYGQIESLSLIKDHSTLTQKLIGLEQAHAAFRAQLSMLTASSLGKHTPSIAPECTLAELKARLATLQTQASQAELNDQLLEKLLSQAPADYVSEIRKIAQAFNEFEFEQAQVLISTLQQALAVEES